LGTTKKEQFMFTTLMCAGMVICMSFYNLLLIEELSLRFFTHMLAGLFPGFAVALLLDIFVVGPAARSILHKVTNQQTKPVKKILFMSTLMIAGMVLFMSLYGVIVSAGITSSFLHDYTNAVLKNVLVALPLQLLVMGPLVRAAFLKLTAGKQAA